MKTTNDYLNYKFIELKISEILLRLGVYPKYKGYNYLKDSVLYAYEKPEALSNLKNNLYPIIASKHNISVCQIQSGIRNVVEMMYLRGYVNKINEIFNVKIISDNEKLTSGELIALLSSKVFLDNYNVN